MLGNQDPEFIKKWEQIQCLLDLTDLLIIEQTKQDASKVTADIQVLKADLKKSMENIHLIKLDEN